MPFSVQLCYVCRAGDQGGSDGGDRERVLGLEEEPWRATAPSSRETASALAVGVAHIGFSHFAVAGYPVPVIKVQEQIKVK